MLDLNKTLDLATIKNRQAQTLESLIDKLDQRGLLVFLVLLGQQAMKILSEDHIAGRIRKDSRLLHSEGDVIEGSKD